MFVSDVCFPTRCTTSHRSSTMVWMGMSFESKCIHFKSWHSLCWSLLLAFSLIKITKPQKAHSENKEFELSPQVFPWLYWGGWTLYALGYTISGLHKLQSPSWIDGSALNHVLQSPLSRDNALCHFLLQSNPLILQLSTWVSLFVEISFLPLGLFYHTRKLYWFAFLGLHLGVLLVVNFTDLTMGVLMMHFFLFDPRWFFRINVSPSEAKLE